MKKLFFVIWCSVGSLSGAMIANRAGRSLDDFLWSDLADSIAVVRQVSNLEPSQRVHKLISLLKNGRYDSFRDCAQHGALADLRDDLVFKLVWSMVSDSYISYDIKCLALNEIYNEVPRLVDIRDGRGNLLLAIVAWHGDNYVWLAEWLLCRGASPNVYNSIGYAIVATAVRMKHYRIVECLLRYGAEINAPSALQGRWGSDLSIAQVAWLAGMPAAIANLFLKRNREILDSER